MSIFNRWGALIFETNDIPLNEEQLGWDGTFKEQTLPVDVFVYYIIVEFIDEEQIAYEGDITIIK